MFISFEGMDACGKTTQMDLLQAALEEKNIQVFRSREPGGSPLAESLRHLLLAREEEKVHAVTEALLYAAARAQHVRQTLRPALERGDWVISDRYIDSSLVYQGLGRDLGLDYVWSINERAIDGLWPDRTFVLDLSVKESKARMEERKQGLDRLEVEGDVFKERLRQGFRQLAGGPPASQSALYGQALEKMGSPAGRLVLVDGRKDPQALHQIILESLGLS